MKLNKVNKFIMMALIMVLICSSVGLAFADEVTSTGSVGSMRIYLHTVETKRPLDGIDLTVYKIANYDNGLEVELINGFENSNVTKELLADPNNTLAEGLDEYIKTNEVVEYTKVTSNADGWAELNNVPDGIYYIYYDGSNDTKDRIVSINSVIVATPYLDGETLRRDVECKPKCEETATGMVYITWEDEGYEYKRPAYVEVDLVKEVEKEASVQRTIVLSTSIRYMNLVVEVVKELVERKQVTPEMNWTYNYDELSPIIKYDIEYRGVPSDYTTSIKLEDKNVWHIHNVYKPSGYPATGDNSNLTLDLILIISGAVLLVGAVTVLVLRNRKSKKSEKVEV